MYKLIFYMLFLLVAINGVLIWQTRKKEIVAETTILTAQECLGLDVSSSNTLLLPDALSLIK